MRMNLAAAGALMALLSGCSLLGGGGAVDEDNFYEKYSQVSCDINKKCFRGYFESEWDDVAECVDDLTDAAEDYEDYYDDCDFDDDKAADCLASIKAATCGEIYEGDEDIYEDCLEVWDCE